VASFSVSEAAGFPLLFTHLDGALCLPPAPPLIEICPELPSLSFAITSSGTTIWMDASYPNFGLIVGALTNGVADEIEWTISHPRCCGGVGHEGTERELFDDQL
jgi:hypothetical protein